jgi:succinyl-CoA:acetate CoA-transferase
VDYLAEAVDRRIGSPVFRGKIRDARCAAEFIRDGMTVAMSGFTPAGYPKAVPVALARRVAESGETCKIFLLTGASVGDEVDGELSRLGIIARRSPYQTSDHLRGRINGGHAAFFDTHLSEVDPHIRRGFYGPVDVGVIEAVKITEDGLVVPSTSVGNAPTVLRAAKKVIIEINESQPEELEGFHDIFIPGDPPNRQQIPISSPGDRIGRPYMEVDPEKVCAVVLTNGKDRPRELEPSDEACDGIAQHLVSFLETEARRGRLPGNLLPVQSGVGFVANSLLKGFLFSSFSELSVYSEVIQDGIVDLLDAGKVRIASATALTLSPKRLEQFLEDLSKYRGRVILRPQEITNSPEVIGRLGVIAINTAVEADIYGNVNSSHILGTRLMNGLGGSGDFARNAYLSVFCTPSIKKDGAISSIVPLVSHTDHTEHDVDIIATEQGVADLRGLVPAERAPRIIEKCAHPSYRPQLLDYWERSKHAGGHYPIDLSSAFSWHVSLTQTGTMRIK